MRWVKEHSIFKKSGRPLMSVSKVGTYLWLVTREIRKFYQERDRNPSKECTYVTYKTTYEFPLRLLEITRERHVEKRDHKIRYL